MNQLAALAQEGGLLRRFFLEPPAALTAANGVIGVGLAYNADVVAAVVRDLRREGLLPEDNVERSALVTRVLEGLAGDSLGGRRIEDGDRPAYHVGEVLRWWHWLSLARYGSRMKPIEIQIAIGPRFGQHKASNPAQGPTRHEQFPTSYEGFPIVFRRCRRSRLHLAESGGRIRGETSAYGTLGGFLSAAGGHFAVTAAHVFSDPNGRARGTPAFLGLGGAARRALQRVSLGLSGASPVALRPESGQLVYSSPADAVAPAGCTLEAAPNSKGLDLAVVSWPDNAASARQVTTSLSLAECSQVLKGAFVGARSGAVAIRITNYSIWHSYDLDDTGTAQACISNCVQIALEKRPYVWADVSRPGDSGAWVMAPSAQGPRWLGMLVGGDGERTGVVQACRILDHLATRIGTAIPSL